MAGSAPGRVRHWPDRANINRLAPWPRAWREAPSYRSSSTEGIPFLGFIVYPEQGRLKTRKGIHYARVLRKLVSEYHAGRRTMDEVNASIWGMGEPRALREHRGTPEGRSAAHPTASRCRRSPRGAGDMLTERSPRWRGLTSHQPTPT